MLEDRILFIDGEAIVIDKPAGLPVDTPRRGGDSLVGAARRAEAAASSGRRRRCTGSTRTRRAACCSRATPRRARVFQQAFEARQVEKYLSRGRRRRGRGGRGHDRPAAGQEIERRSRLADGRRRRRASAAITHWRRIAVRDGRTLVEFRPVTGRTHQIRVHAREAFGAAIVGDRVYGVPGGPMLLHASRLVVPREQQAGDRRHRAAAGLFRGLAAMRPEDVVIPEDALSESFLAATGPGGQNVNKVATAVPAARRRVQARPAARRL